jgi:hypothetical protein
MGGNIIKQDYMGMIQWLDIEDCKTTNLEQPLKTEIG